MGYKHLNTKQKQQYLSLLDLLIHLFPPTSHSLTLPFRQTNFKNQILSKLQPLSLPFSHLSPERHLCFQLPFIPITIPFVVKISSHIPLTDEPIQTKYLVQCLTYSRHSINKILLLLLSAVYNTFLAQIIGLWSPLAQFSSPLCYTHSLYRHIGGVVSPTRFY